MNPLEKIIDLCKNEEGKVFIMDESGDISLVILGVGEYEKLKNHPSLPKPVETDPEVVNKKIMEAQLSDQEVVASSPVINIPRVDSDITTRDESIDPSFNFEG